MEKIRRKRALDFEDSAYLFLYVCIYLLLQDYVCKINVPFKFPFYYPEILMHFEAAQFD